jgi:peptidyl-prolyl cis-trans isomerase D
MAVIGKIRKNSGLLVIVIGVALAAFVLGDFSKTQSKTTDSIGEINGEKVSYREFINKLEQNIEYEKQRVGKQNLTANESFSVRQMTWNQYLNDIIMGDEYAAIGLEVSSDELFELVQGNNPHRFIMQYFSNPNTGEFDRNVVLNFLQNIDNMDQATTQQWLQIEKAIKSDQLAQKYINLVRKGYYIPNEFAEAEFKAQNEKVKINLIAKSFYDISDSLVSVSDDEITKYYQENIANYQQQEELRDVDYVMFEVMPSVEDRVRTTNQIADLYEEFQVTDDIITFVNSVSDIRYDSTFYKKGELPVQLDDKVFNSKVGTFIEPYLDNDIYHMAKIIDVQNRPDSLSASHVLIGYQGAQSAGPEITRTKEEAKALADSIYRVVNRNQNKINEIAVSMSDDPSAKENNGDTGWFPDMAMLGSFNNAVLETAINDIVIAETVFGYHIIRVMGKKGFAKRARVAIIERAIEPSGQTYQDVYTEASKFAAMNTTADEYENAIIEQGLNKRNVPGLRVMSNYIAGINYPRNIVQWAFKEETEVGSISEIFDFDGKYVVAILNGIHEKGDLPLDDVYELAKAEMIKEKKFEYIQQQVNGKTDFDQIAAGLSVDPKGMELTFASPNIDIYGREPELVGKVFSMKLGETSGLIKGNNGVYQFKIDEITPAAEGTGVDFYKTQLLMMLESRLANNSLFQALEANSEIEDNRHIFY